METKMKITTAVVAVVMVVAAVLIVAIALTNTVTVKTSVPRNAPRVRTFYFASAEVLWDYAPQETDLLKERQQYAEPFLENSENPLRLGSKYKKAVFREYTDGTYSVAKSRPLWLGILGPIIEAETGDTVKIHLYNNATHPVSLHTHGAKYQKRHEGAFYQDNTLDKRDDKVFPGENFTYLWTVPDDRGPTGSDTPCMLWAYHSHVSGDEDIHTGLIGPLLICREGVLEKIHENPESWQYFILLFLIFDENQSWYLDENIASKRSSSSQEINEEVKEDELFQESNHMYSINGFMYNNLQGLELCRESQVTWHLMGMGNEADIHAVIFTGHPILVRGHRTDVVHLFPAKFESAVMSAHREGSWPIKSEVGDHDLAGMEAKFLVQDCGNHSTSSYSNTSVGVTRKFFIAAEEIAWDYAPSARNEMNGVPLLNDSEAKAFFESANNRIGGTYKKVVYRGYKDEDFNEPLPHPSYLGLLGPTIRVEVGDTLEVHFFNKASKTFAFQLKAFVCSDCGTNGANESVAPMGNRTYSFFISEDLGPLSKDPQCIAWRYFSAVEHMKDSYAGLNGLLLTCRPRSLNADGTLRNVDKEFVLMFAVMDENNSPYIDENIAEYITGADPVDKEDPDFVESNLMHSINGLMYGNLIGLDMCLSDEVSWNIFAIGHEVDMHVAHFRGNSFLRNGLNRDTVDIMSGSHETVSMKPDSVGKWALECRTNDHLRGGMQTWYEVKSCDYQEDTQVKVENKTRKYYIAAVDEEWDYSPSDYHIVTGENLTENEDSRIFVTRDATHIGSKYKKTLFREFTDSSFSEYKLRSPEEEHLGLLGPVIKAEIGDSIQVVFRNKATREFNIRPHGLLENSSEVTGVEPGGTVTYIWTVPPRSGPTKGSFNCSSWMYYSTVDSIKDINTGLVGPLVICNPGILTDTGSRTDVDKEFNILFTVFDENESWHLDENVQNYCFEPEKVDAAADDFRESNLKHALNGRLYGTLSGLEGTVGDTVAWYLMGLGNEVDMHTAHFHGLTFTERDDPLAGPEGHRADVADLFPGIFRTVEMTFDTPGTWLFHCHVDDHLKGGMVALVTVKDRNGTADGLH